MLQQPCTPVPHSALPTAAELLGASAERIYDYYWNTWTYFQEVMKVGSLDKPLDWLEQQDAWARQQVPPARSAAMWCCKLAAPAHKANPARCKSSGHGSGMEGAGRAACPGCQNDHQRGCASWADRAAAEPRRWPSCSVRLICRTSILLDRLTAACRLPQVTGNTSSYFRMLGLVLAQLDGLAQGYGARAAAEQDPVRVPSLTWRDFLFVNGNGAPAGHPGAGRRLRAAPAWPLLGVDRASEPCCGALGQALPCWEGAAAAGLWQLPSSCAPYACWAVTQRSLAVQGSCMTSFPAWTLPWRRMLQQCSRSRRTLPSRSGAGAAP